MMELQRQLEIKKSLRLSAFRRRNTGLEQLNKTNFELETAYTRYDDDDSEDAQSYDVAEKENFMAIVHIDGNNMGALSQKVTEAAGDDWEECCKRHQVFSKKVDETFRSTLKKTKEWVQQWVDSLPENERPVNLPFYSIIAAGDDICVATAGKIGLECAAFFLRQLKKDSEYKACAGVVLVHKSHPFYRAYALSEELCGSAKQYLAEMKSKLPIEEQSSAALSAMDWHIEFGQGKADIREIREDYYAEDSGSDGTNHLLTLRPVLLDSGEKRDYAFVAETYQHLKNSGNSRSKLKGLREKMKQGVYEAEAYVKFYGLKQVDVCDYVEDGENRRSLLFDAIEMMDHLTLMSEEGKA